MVSQYIYTNVIGSFIFDEEGSLIESSDSEEKLLKKYNDAKKPELQQLKNSLCYFKDKKYYTAFYEKNLEIAKQKIKESVKNDILVIQAINVISDLTKVINILATSLREWYELYNPEFSRAVPDTEGFVREILTNNKKELLIQISVPLSMGADLSSEDVQAIMELAKEIKSLFSQKKKQEEYLEVLMKKLCPNMMAITGAVLGAKLLEHTGSLEHLSELPSSTIQLLGAEKALFRHMTTGARCPKYGILFQHPFVSQAKKQNQGKVARMLADKISIAVKIDFFKGTFIGDALKKQLAEKLP